jgi:hypothetical protein
MPPALYVAKNSDCSVYSNGCCGWHQPSYNRVRPCMYIDSLPDSLSCCLVPNTPYRKSNKMDLNKTLKHDTSNLVTTNRHPAFRHNRVIPNPVQIETTANKRHPMTYSQSSSAPSLNSTTMDHSTPSQQEKTRFFSEGLSPISPDYRDIESNLFIVSMLLNGSPMCVKYDATFATHLSNASMALVSYAMKGISCFNEIEIAGKQTILPVQPWVLWAFVMQELCKTIVHLLSRNPSEVLLISVHPLQSVDSTLLEWEHHPSYMKWTSAHPPTSCPTNVLSLLEGYATSLKAAMGLLMISAARAFGPVSRTCGDFNILGYRDPDQSVDTPRNLYFGDPNVTVKNSPGIFIYEAGINVIEICKALEAHQYNQMADELKDLAAEALFSSMTHMYPEKMQADLIAIEERITPPLEKQHSLRATASEFRPSLAQPVKDKTVRKTLISEPVQTTSRSPLAIQPRNVNETFQSTKGPTDREGIPSSAPRPSVPPQENPIRYQGVQAHTNPATSTLMLPQPRPYNPSMTDHNINRVTPVILSPELQIPQIVGTQRLPLASPTLHPRFQITRAANGYSIPPMADPVLQAYQTAITRSEEQLFLECRRTAQRLLGLPVSPKLPPPPSFWPPPAFWYYPPALLSPGPVATFQNPQVSLPAHSLSSSAGHLHVSQNSPEYDAAQYVQTLFELANNSPQSLYFKSPIPVGSHTCSDTEPPGPQLSSQLQPIPGILYREPARPTHPTHSQGSTSDCSLEPSYHHSARRPRRFRRSDSETKSHGRPLAPHLDDYIEYPRRRGSR